MRLFVTGANGFLGAAVVANAVANGHQVVAMVRDASKYEPPQQHTDQVAVVQGDLRGSGEWQQRLADCDAVVHLAASFTDFYTQFASTVQGTEQLLAAMHTVGLKRLVLVSTFSIYDYRSLAAESTLDETAPLESRPQDLDDYTKTKLAQEHLVDEFAAAGGLVTVLRPGAIYGPGKMWDAGMTLKLNHRVWLAFGPNVRQKLTFVDNCAEAIVLAANTPAAIGEVINVVDDETPTQRQYAQVMKDAGFEVPFGLPVPIGVVQLGAKLLDVMNRKRYGGRAKIPWYAVPAKLDQRFKQFRYPNAKARRVLNWAPRFNLRQGVVEALRRERDALASKD